VGSGRLLRTVRLVPTRFAAIARRLTRSPARWDLAAALLYLVVSLLLYATNPGAQRPSSDGHYGWIYARSLAYDGDLDFANDYDLCGDPWTMGWTTPTNHRANVFYIGPAVFWTPAIWILKHFVHGAPNVAGGCVGPLPSLVLAMSSVAGAVLVLMTGAILRRWVGAGTAALAALLATLGGHAIYLTALLPSYSHIYDAMCIALYLYVVVRIREKGPSYGRLALAGGLLGLAFLQRTSSAVFFVVAIGALLRPTPAAALRSSVRSLAIVAVCAVLSGVVPLLAANEVILGHATLIAHGPYIFWPAHAHPLLLLFDERGGLFDAAPVLWLGVPGLALLLRRKDARWLGLPLLFCATFEIYVASSALDWQGARRVLNLTPLGALCIALTVQRAGRWAWARPRRVGVAAATAAVATVAWANASVVVGFARGKLAWDRPLTSSERYGEGQKQELDAIEDHVGSLAVLPAAWVFSLRYRLEPAAFGWAAQPDWYGRDYHSLEYARADFPFDAPETRRLVRGVRIDDPEPGACMVGSRATAVFSLGWPVTTRARLVYDATAPDTVSVRTRSFLGVETAWGPGVLLHPGKGRRVILRVPPGALDSGINQLEVERGSDAGSLCLHALEFVDDTRYPAVPEAIGSAPVHMWHAGTYDPGPVATPSVAVGHVAAGDWMVEVHETASQQIGYYAGLPSEFTSPALLDVRGFRPRVAADTNGTVIEVHQGTPGVGGLLSKVGRVAVDGAQVAVAWAASSQYGSGFHPAIAALGGRAIEVDMADAGGSTLLLRRGSISGGTIAWSAPEPLGTPGFNPTVAVAAVAGSADALVVEAHQQGAKYGSVLLRIGRWSSGGDGSISWSQPREYDQGVFPSLALFGKTIVELHQGQDDSGSLRVRVGTIGDDGEVSWAPSSKYDSGGHPSIAIDPATGKGVEVHEGAAGLGPLLEHYVDVY
jgi:hypothetical protein